SEKSKADSEEQYIIYLLISLSPLFKALYKLLLLLFHGKGVNTHDHFTESIVHELLSVGPSELIYISVRKQIYFIIGFNVNNLFCKLNITVFHTTNGVLVGFYFQQFAISDEVQWNFSSCVFKFFRFRIINAQCHIHAV